MKPIWFVIVHTLAEPPEYYQVDTILEVIATYTSQIHKLYSEKVNPMAYNHQGPGSIRVHFLYREIDNPIKEKFLETGTN